MQITSIFGSPFQRSRSAWLQQLELTRLEASAHGVSSIALRELPAQPLLLADPRAFHRPRRRAVLLPKFGN